MTEQAKEFPENRIHNLSNGNRLKNETSPYLLQHAHNPVDWFPWGDEAFEKARKEDKPILVSIGYAACHWCHVMERESFENPDVANIMNENFVNIKVDREERPDVDHIYMDAVQAMTGSGGWPLNVFLTPDLRPFYGGTYFPPRKAFNRASWTDILLSMHQAYKERKQEVEEQAKHLTEHMELSNAFGKSVSEDDVFEASRFEEAFRNIMKTADLQWGGFGRAPKFPQSFTIHFLLAYGHEKNNPEALDQAFLSLDKMLQGGIYDQVGGGFARYSTDTEWLVPHFEKMLYDNALLVSVLSEAYQLSQNQVYKDIIEETLAFVERELMHPDGGFYSALDADSEGVEGKFYVWKEEEVKQILEEDANLFNEYFDITAEGNWEENNIPWVRTPEKEFADENQIDPEQLKKIIKSGKQKLLEARKARIRPQLDDKIILGWNALMNIGFTKAFAATGDQVYLERAENNMKFLLESFRTKGELLNHTWKNGIAKHPAFLDDYAYLIAALIELGQATANFNYFEQASAFTDIVLKHFSDTDTAFFYYTHKDQHDVLLRKKEIYDSAVPSGNSMMAYNLYRLSIVYNRQDWKERTNQALIAIGDIVLKYPTSFGVWLSLLFEVFSGTNELAIVGKESKNYLGKIQKLYLPHRLTMASPHPDPSYPLLAGKPDSKHTFIYLCRNYACQQPVSTISELVTLLGRK